MISAALRTAFYPLVAASTLAYLWVVLHRTSGAVDQHHGLFVAAMVGALILVEAIWPLQTRWRMTAPLLLRRDLPYLLLNGATIGLGNVLATWVLLHHGLKPPTQWMSGLPIVPAALLSLLVNDGLWYGLHRYSHEGQRRLGRWLWRVHAAHHRPAQVYVLMHAVAHPLNTVFVRILLTIPPWLLGISPEALYVAQVVTGVQGLVSHFNVDSRAGWFDHLLVGTELHRWHHAVGARGNYAAVLSVWDRLFGTFIHRPGVHPEHLGVGDGTDVPADTAYGQMLLDPMARRGRPDASVQSVRSTRSPAARPDPQPSCARRPGDRRVR